MKKCRMQPHVASKWWALMTEEEKAQLKFPTSRHVLNGINVYIIVNGANDAKLSNDYNKLSVEEKKACRLTAREVNKRSHLCRYSWSVAKSAIVEHYRRHQSKDSGRFILDRAVAQGFMDLTTEDILNSHRQMKRIAHLHKFLLSPADVLQHEGIRRDTKTAQAYAKSLNDLIEDLVG